MASLAIFLSALLQEGRPAEGRALFEKRCANCHFVPDASIQRDKIWTTLLKTTA